MNWNDYFRYEDGNLYWKISKQKVKLGAKAGKVSKSTGYVRLMIEGKHKVAHRIIWEMNNGPIP